MQQQPTPTKKKHKLPSAFTILFLLIALMAVLTWIIPAGTYKSDSAGNLISGTYHTVAHHYQGIWDVFMAPVTGMIGNKATTGAIGRNRDRPFHSRDWWILGRR